MKKIILDTNALMAVAEFNLDVFTEVGYCCDFTYQLYVLKSTITELEKIKVEQKLKYKLYAKLALSILTQKMGSKEVKLLADQKPELSTDDNLILESKQGVLVLTQDIALKRKLTRPYLTIRQKKKVVVMM
ncbi:hypothetical protein HN385_00735 [archaeon]|jgi:rRNA-processing protein FCF1|nr:hypothetical protein [archaeon]MBT3450925.1 hypothetical protein [archaeon]MBT6869571.1 hypothetical protein [archaeon]MBT7193437.1 hypothetical protein [archaeon]MBT7381028.1 hypothetical protein [archaeon]